MNEDYTSKKTGIDWIWRWGITARLSALIVFCALFLPWCGELKGTDMLKASGMEQLYIFPIAAIVLAVIPFAGLHLKRFISESFVSAVVTFAAIYVGYRFRAMRGIGVDVTVLGGLIGTAGGAVGLWFYKKNAFASTAPPQDDFKEVDSSTD